MTTSFFSQNSLNDEHYSSLSRAFIFLKVYFAWGITGSNGSNLLKIYLTGDVFLFGDAFLFGGAFPLVWCGAFPLVAVTLLPPFQDFLHSLGSLFLFSWKWSNWFGGLFTWILDKTAPSFSLKTCFFSHEPQVPSKSLFKNMEHLWSLNLLLRTFLDFSRKHFMSLYEHLSLLLKYVLFEEYLV